MSGRAFDERVVIRDAGLLRRLRNAVDIRSNRDDRLARSPRRDPRRRHAGVCALDPEAVLLEDVSEIPRSLGFLEAELGVAEDLIDHLLRHHAHGLDFSRGLALELLDARRSRWRGCGRRRRRAATAALRADADGTREDEQKADASGAHDRCHTRIIATRSRQKMYFKPNWSCRALFDVLVTRPPAAVSIVVFGS